MDATYYSVIDICCGMGGLSLAARDIGMNPSIGIDTNEDALKTYMRNFPDATAIKGDISSKSTIDLCIENSKKLKRNSNLIVVSGPPCQGFSVAGPRNPKDPRNDILVYVADAISVIRPTSALIENVAAVLSPRNSDRINKLKSILSKSGYHITTITLDALYFGVPQRRRRAFFLITKKKLNENDLAEFMKSMFGEKKTVGNAMAGLFSPKVRPEVYVDEEDNGAPPNHFAMQHSERVKKKIALIKPGTGPLSYRRLDPNKPTKTLISGHRAPPAHPYEPRSLTVREAARLQGFPDSFRVYGKFGKQMEQVTNAVPPPMGAAVLTALLKL